MLAFPLPKATLGRLAVAAVITLAAGATPARAADDQPDARPLSPAQVALFMTPHMKNIEHPETLQYSFTRDGASGFTDTVSERITSVHPDGSKAVSFEFFTGERRKPFPGVDDFSGNPLLMVFLENDVNTMRDTLGVSATYFRNRVREAMVDRATVAATTYTLDGKPVAAQEVTVQPFAGDQRFDRLPTVQAKTYRFILSDAVPGGLAEISTAMPADAAQDIPAAGEKIVFAGVAP